MADASDERWRRPTIAYELAYSILPMYAYSRLEHLRARLAEAPRAMSMTLYGMACQARGIEPRGDEVRSFLRWHEATLDDGASALVCEFPEPTPLDPAAPWSQLQVLAPHFAAIVTDDEAVAYFVLGQRPIEGGTTLRSVSDDGVNANLGPGPAPRLPDLLQALSRWRLRA